MLLLSGIFLYGCTTVYPVTPVKGTLFLFSLRQLWAKLIFMHKFLWDCKFAISLGNYLVIQLTDFIARLGCFLKSTKLSSKMAILFFVPTRDKCKLLLFYILTGYRFGGVCALKLSKKLALKQSWPRLKSAPWYGMQGPQVTPQLVSP